MNFCEECRWIDFDEKRTTDQGWTVCRRFPPRVVPGNTDLAHMTMWPAVRKGDFCGLFEGEPEEAGPEVAG